MKTKMIVGALLAAVVVFALGVSPFGWRASVTKRMIAGELTGVGWGDYLSDIRPGGGQVFVETRTGDVSQDVNFLSRRSDDSPCGFLWETALGSFWGRADDRPILGPIVAEQVEGKVYSFQNVTVKPGDVVFDVGSHLGVFTRVALNAGASKVVAIEPEPVNITCYKQTFEQEIKDGRVVLVEAAAWHSKDQLHFSRAHESWSGMLYERGSLVVEALPIDTIVDDLKLDKVDFLKLDIEGAERHALAGAKMTLTRFSPDIAVAMYHLPDDPQVITDVVESANAAYSVAESKSHEHGSHVGYFSTQTHE